MKKILTVFIFLSFSLSAFSQVFKISDTFGANENTLSGVNFFEGDYLTFADRIQSDLKTKYVSGRARLDFYNLNLLDKKKWTGDEYKAQILFKGYLQAGIPYISLVAGNSFFSKFDIKASEVFPLDEVPNYGKVLKDGIGLYSEINFDKKNKLSLGAAVESDTIFAGEDFALDFGFDFVQKNTFSLGASIRDVTQGAFGKYSLFGGYYFKDFKITSGFIYNNTDEDILPYEAKYSLQLGFLYKNKDNGIRASLALVSALNSEYLAAKKQVTKNYDYDAFPFMAAASFDYDFSNGLEAGLLLKFSDLIGEYNCGSFVLYPHLNYVFCNDLLELDGGLKFDFNNSGASRHLDFSLPLSLKISWQTFK